MTGLAIEDFAAPLPPAAVVPRGARRGGRSLHPRQRPAGPHRRELAEEKCSALEISTTPRTTPATMAMTTAAAIPNHMAFMG